MDVSRRDFLKMTSTAGAGLVFGLHLPSKNPLSTKSIPTASFEPNAWLRIDPQGVVTITVAKSEMGQGVHTALPMIVAEELEANWSDVRIEQAPAHPTKYGRQTTGGSSSIRRSMDTLRRAGATARELLIRAAAQRWGVDWRSCRAENGTVVHRLTKKKLTYGELVEAAAKIPVPDEVPLKNPRDFQIVGTAVDRLDTVKKTEGTAQFGIDIKVPRMLFAAVARCPIFGGSLDTFDDAKTRKVRGVQHVAQIDSGIAVVADSTWAAIQGRRTLEIKWNEGPNASLSMEDLREMFKEKGKKRGAVARSEGDVSTALANGAKTLEAVYEAPFQAHAPMEPMNCVADVRRDRCTIWAATQAPQPAQRKAAEITGLPLDAITLYVTLLGGGFGRRLEPDFVAEAVQISKAVGAPIKLIWTREDDMHHDFYRPASYHHLSGGLDGKGHLVAWAHRIVAPSILHRWAPNSVKNGLDESAVDGAADLPYAIPNIQVDYVMANTAVPVGWWRSVFASQNAFANESFVDELAQASGQDPYEFRLKLLSDSPRHANVLQLAATKAGWGLPLPEGHYRGIAFHSSFGSHVAQVAEISVNDERVRVHRVVCAIDCGRTVNPNIIKAQMESAIVYGLSAALKGSITIRNGRVQQSNFHDFKLLRISEMPNVDVHIMPSTKPPGGVGEPGVPPIAPAVANALFAATGRRVRALPIRAEDLRTT